MGKGHRTTLSGSAIVKRPADAPSVAEEKRAQECIGRIRACIDRGRAAYVELAVAVAEFDALEAWRATGASTKREFLADADIDIGYDEYYRLLGVGKIAGVLGVEAVLGIPAYRVERGILPVVQFSEDRKRIENKAEVEELLADARALSRGDFFIRARERMRGEDEAAPVPLVKEGETVYAADELPIGTVRRVEVSQDGTRHTVVLSLATEDIRRQGKRVSLFWNQG